MNKLIKLNSVKPSVYNDIESKLDNVATLIYLRNY